jgi:Ca-activated chloride channel family protein
MKTIAILTLLTALLAPAMLATGVAIVDAHTPTYLRLDSSTVGVSVEGQISTTTTTKYFINNGTAVAVKYGFPLSEQASAVQLRWLVGGVWRTASVAGGSQDTTLPGDGTPAASLLTYLGTTPLYFSIPQQVDAGATLAVELTYVELLPYAFGDVSYRYPGDYHLVQSGPIGLQRFDFSLSSQRTIDSIAILSAQTADQLTNNGLSAFVGIEQYEQPAGDDYRIRYTLNAAELGLFFYSSVHADTALPDTLGRGYLTFIAEPNPATNTESIAKVFTLIIDRSGSMSGTKIVQARDAATYIVQNLNPGDRFNLIDFDDVITSFRPTHVPYTTDSRDSALSYISTLTARGLTNISGVFSAAVPQFTTAGDSTANIIIFLTDGEPTVGITSLEPLVQHVDSLVTASEKNINLFCFGIGSSVNTQLLTLFSAHNKGLADFLGNDELYGRITDFYRTIRNPVLLNSHIVFSPPIVSQIYPDSLPNLYKGKQMIVAGRYQDVGPVQITLSGTAFGQPVEYVYNVVLADSAVPSYQFLPKIWAKRKIESLLVRYYGLNASTPQADTLKQEIIAISSAYGVLSPFTSFTGEITDVEGGMDDDQRLPVEFALLGNYPNPFNPSTTIRIQLNVSYVGDLEVRIYNSLGQVIRILTIQSHGNGTYEVLWDGLGNDGLELPSGVYFYGIEVGNSVLVGKMNLVR